MTETGEGAARCGKVGPAGEERPSTVTVEEPTQRQTGCGEVWAVCTLSTGGQSVLSRSQPASTHLPLTV